MDAGAQEYKTLPFLFDKILTNENIAQKWNKLVITECEITYIIFNKWWKHTCSSIIYRSMQFGVFIILFESVL